MNGTGASVSIDKGKKSWSFTFGGNLGLDLPASLFDLKQRIFGTDDKFKTDWPSTNLEAYVLHNYGVRKPRKVPFGHKRLHYGLNKVIKDEEKGKSTWSRYLELDQLGRMNVDAIVEEANRHQSRERVCVAFKEYNKDSTDFFMLAFLSLRKEAKPVSFKDALGRHFTFPFETCRKWDVSIISPLTNPCEAQERLETY